MLELIELYNRDLGGDLDTKKNFVLPDKSIMISLKIPHLTTEKSLQFHHKYSAFHSGLDNWSNEWVFWLMDKQYDELSIRRTLADGIHAQNLGIYSTQKLNHPIMFLTRRPNPQQLIGLSVYNIVNNCAHVEINHFGKPVKLN